MHALIIGVGQYPHCHPGAEVSDFGALAAFAARLMPLSSPPRSAWAVADWLLLEQVHDPVAPLRSVDLLVSANAGFGGVDSPTFDSVRAAFDRWYARCDSHADNVAFFFFSGHGCARGDQVLLLEDVGKVPHRFFDKAISLQPMFRGMNQCRADTQCYFIDACRGVPYELLLLDGIATGHLIQPILREDFKEAPVVFATGPGRSAYGVGGGITLFTTALLQALGGLGAYQVNGAWEITTDRIGPSICRLLEWNQEPGGLGQQASVEGRCSGRRSIRRLRTSPLVPFRLGCQPRAALSSADLSLIQALSGHVVLERSRNAMIWEDMAPAACYGLRADFPTGNYGDALEELHLLPPHVEYDMEVK